MEVRPDYYDSFRCIADKCRHNCCIGWEIDIDDDTLKKYQTTDGSLNEKLNKNIALDPCAHFVLSENERCPFLNNQNLCELIIAGGEDMLCQICKDHPRFFGDIYGVTEKGVGISCEAAARLILTKTSPVKLISDSVVPNNDFFNYRNEIFTILQNREKSLNDRIAELLAWADVSLPINDIDFIEVYKKLERLDNDWDNYLDSIDTISFSIPQALEIPCEQLICYFIYRHLSGALEDFMFAERIQFAVLSCLIIASLSKNTEAMIEISRMYSCEIEYSDENINILLDILNEYNEK
ncbi:MAG: flagellin lysine-N-methylase [Clostridia bacterium]|nr:flagellin lysine-N-methylase [Clostridia bacterium]